MALNPQESAERRARNRADSAAILRDRGVEFTTNNAGVHLIIERNGERFNFWPGTGLWARGNAAADPRQRGVFNLLKALGL